MGRVVDFGVFLPVGTGGFLPSTTSPAVAGDYLYNRRVVRVAEEVGFGFAVSMARWRGFGGPSRYSDATLESITATAGLAEATERIRLFCTIHTVLFHPAQAAKMVATLDQISGGRVGINIVAGSNPIDHGQMGLWRGLAHDEQYEYAREWTQVLRALWAEDRVTFQGKYFDLVDCLSWPKPDMGREEPSFLCAATSDTGIRFTAEHAQASLVNAPTIEKLIETGKKVKSISTSTGEPVKAVGLIMVVPGRTDEEAHERVRVFDDGVDVDALNEQVWTFSASVKELGSDADKRTTERAYDESGRARAVPASAAVGSPDTVARVVAEVVEQGEFDAIGFYVPDYVHDLDLVGSEVLPRLARLGIRPGRVL